MLGVNRLCEDCDDRNVWVKYRLRRCEVMPDGIVMFCALHKVKLSLPSSPQGETSLRSNFTAEGNFTCLLGQT